MTLQQRVHWRIVGLAIVTGALTLIASLAFGQTTPGAHFSRAELGFTTSLYNQLYPDFDLDGNRNTIEIVEERPIPNGGGVTEFRVAQVAPTGPFRMCMGQWINPYTRVWEHLGSDPAIWFVTRLANLGGRYVIWYFTATDVGFLNIDIPSC